MSQYWHSSMYPYNITKPQWGKLVTQDADILHNINDTKDLIVRYGSFRLK